MTIETGQIIPSLEFPEITKEQLVEYSQASGDDNPIHLSDEAARKAGLNGVIAHGMLIASLVSERALRFLRELGESQNWKLTKYQVRFKAMTFPGDVISVAGSVKERSETSLKLELRASTQRNEVTTIGHLNFESNA